MTAIEHFEKKVGITQRRYDLAASKEALLDLLLQDLERDYRDESKDLAVSVDTLLTLAKSQVAALEATYR